MKWLIGSLVLLCFGCSNQIHHLSGYTNYKTDFQIYITNDSLQLCFMTPADINYPTSKRDLKKALRKSEFKLKEEVVLYGETQYPPYEYVVTVPEDSNQLYNDKYIILDTIIDGRTIRFIGNPLVENAKRSLENDLKSMFSSIGLEEEE